ncbi:uncharacterized protein LOC124813981 [Hydra vulgaris]|uniref:uncharacterized protein LOC124813981 n=1 Tax=Hydra vulgaris TaxID=6087 RepID=UPI001F5F9115|nr:ubiquitin-like-specific protease 1 [Hydra vulgaris]
MIINLHLPSMNRQLEDMIRQAEAIKNISSIEIPLKPLLHNNLLNFEPNKKLDNQWKPNKFKKTRKEKKKKEAKLYQYPVQNQKEEIVLKLSQQHIDLIHNKQDRVICDDIKTKKHILLEYFFRHGPHQLSFSSLLTLENIIPSDILLKLQNSSPHFQKGWLQDEVIGGFLHCLEMKYPSMKYLGPTEALAISYSKSLKLLWKDVDMKIIKQVFIPFNPTNSHWILIHLKVKTEEVTILDPLHCNNMPNNSSYNKCILVAKNLFKQKFNILNAKVISAPSHCLQKDSYNCGVYVCYYALQLCEEKNLNDPFDEVDFRKYIYETLCGSCLKNLESGFESLYNICRILLAI